jgi:hypothetical protein
LSLFDDKTDDAAHSAEKRLYGLANAVDLESEDDDDVDDSNSPDRVVPVPVNDEISEIYEGEDLDAIRASIAPVRMVIAKVRQLIYRSNPGSNCGAASVFGIRRHQLHNQMFASVASGCRCIRTPTTTHPPRRFHSMERYVHTACFCPDLQGPD